MGKMGTHPLTQVVLTKATAQSAATLKIPIAPTLPAPPEKSIRVARTIRCRRLCGAKRPCHSPGSRETRRSKCRGMPRILSRPARTPLRGKPTHALEQLRIDGRTRRNDAHDFAGTTFLSSKRLRSAHRWPRDILCEPASRCNSPPSDAGRRHGTGRALSLCRAVRVIAVRARR